MAEMTSSEDVQVKDEHSSNKQLGTQNIKILTPIKSNTRHSIGINSTSKTGSSNTTSEGKHHHHHLHHHHGHNHHNNPHVIHRTTSESLRLTSDIGHGCITSNTNSNNTTSNSSNSSSCSNNSSSILSNSNSQHLILNAPINIQRKPKTSSFQITSVTVGNKLSADNGEDSADDLDESHTDDNSRITDIENETPSFSEDTFSKEDVFFSSSALGAAPVIPTSSQYGLVIVDPDLGGVGTNGQNLPNVHVSVTDTGINIVGSSNNKDCEQKDMQHRNERFKVVKIESTEPFKRGRWMCMDYLDHTTLQQNNTETKIVSTSTTTTSTTIPSSVTTTATTTTATNISGQNTGTTTNDSGVVLNDNHIDTGIELTDTIIQKTNNISLVNNNNNNNNNSISPGNTMQHPLINSSLTETQQPQQQQQQNIPQNNITGSGIHAQTLTHIPNIATNVRQTNPIVAQSLPQAQIQQAISSQIITTQQNNTPTSDNNMQGQSQPANFYIANQQILPTQIHGATLPNNININNGNQTNVISSQTTQQQTQSQQQAPQMQSQSQPTTQPQQQQTNIQITSQNSDISNMSGSASVPHTLVQPINIEQTNLIPKAQTLSTQNIQQTENFIPQNFTIPPVVTTSTNNNQTLTGGANGTFTPQGIQTNDITVSIGQTNSTAGIISPCTSSAPSTIVQSLNQNDTTFNQNQQQNQTQPIVVTQDNIPQTISNEQNITSGQVIQTQQIQTTSIAGNGGSGTGTAGTTLQTQQSVISSEEGQQATLEPDSESASGTSAVAIDNKIEQAMDLVKSHLMIAVREEVEVLKEKIAELMDRINQLELENTILKANVSPETLSQLSATIQPAAAKPPQQNTNTSNGPVS